MSRNGHSHPAARQRRGSARKSAALRSLPGRRGPRRESAERNCRGRAGPAAVGEHRDDGTVGVLESANDDIRHGPGRGNAMRPWADVARPHCKGPEDAGCRCGAAVVRVDEVGCRLRLADFEALPEEIGGKLCVDHGDGQLIRPGEALVGSAVAVPRRGEGGAKRAALGVPLRQSGLAERRRGISAVGMPCDDIKAAGRAAPDERCRISALRVPADGVAAGEGQVEPGRIDGCVEDRDEVDGFACIAADLHLRVAWRKVWLVEEPEMGYGQAFLGVELHVPDEEVGIGLSPVSRAAAVPRSAAEVSFEKCSVELPSR